MKTKEEIEQLADSTINKEGYTTDDFIIGFEQGYTQCQEDMADKKYTEEDIRNAIREGRNSIHFENDGSWWEDKAVEEDFIKQLNNDTKDDDLNFLAQTTI